MTRSADTLPDMPPEPHQTHNWLSDLTWGPYLLLCATGVTLALTWLNLSAADGLDKLSALGFWALHVGPLIFLLAVSQMLLGRVPAVGRSPVIAQLLFASVIASLLFSPLALVVDALFQAEGSVDADGGPILLDAVSELAHFFVPTALTWLLINASSLRKVPRPASVEPAVEAPVTPDALATEFWSRVPGRLGRRIVALSAELHYLRVYTTEGEALILFPFGQAVALLGQNAGLQIHRSHWVSLTYVDEVTTENGRVFCKTVGGPVLPVSRSYRAALRNALKTAAQD